MRGRGGVPRELLAGASSTVACRRECVGVVEQLSERSAQSLDVPWRHHASRAEASDDLAKASDVVDDRRNTRAERLQESSGLVELRPVGKDGDRRLRQGALELLRAEIPEPPLGPIALRSAEARSSGIRGSPATSRRAPSTASVARTASGSPL